MDDYIYHGPGHPVGAHFHSGPPGKQGTPGVSPKVEIGEVIDGKVTVTVTDGYGKREREIDLAEVMGLWLESASEETIFKWMDANGETDIDSWMDESADGITESWLDEFGAGLISDWMLSDSQTTIEEWMTNHSDAEWWMDDNGILHLSNVPPDADDRIVAAVDNWLDDHPEASTTVQDGSLTEAKFTDSLKLKALKDYVTPEMFGAVGDGETDDSEAIINCIEAAQEAGLPIKIISDHYLSRGLTLGQVTIASDSKHIFTFQDGISPLVTVESTTTIENLRVDNKVQNYNEDSKIIGILVKGSHCRFNNVEVRNCFRGIEVGYPATGVAYNYFSRCYARNCVEGIYLAATGTNGYTNECSFIECTVRLDSNIKTILTNAGLNDRYAITLERDATTNRNINGNRFICCNVENCFNGFSVRAYYCLFLNCRTDGNDIYYYFHQTNGGYNSVLSAYGTATDGGTQRIYEKLDNDNDLMNNFIQMRNYPLSIDLPRFIPHSTANRPTLAAKDSGSCMFDNTLTKPIWWTGSKWVDASGADA